MKRTAVAPRPAPTPSDLSLTEAAAYLGVSRDTLRRRIAEGALRAHRLGPKLIRVAVADLDELRRPIPAGGGHG